MRSGSVNLGYGGPGHIGISLYGWADSAGPSELFAHYLDAYAGQLVVSDRGTRFDAFPDRLRGDCV